MTTFHLQHVDETLSLATQLARCCQAPLLIHLRGDLGAGKTTFSRGFLRGLGFAGNVKSPTYTLVEPYELDNLHVFHFDLYRLRHPQELIDLAIEDYCDDNCICLIEWPEKGGEFVPAADLHCHLQLDGEGRVLTITANTDRGQALLQQFEKSYDH